ncbi:hypothetical protein [Actinospica robiniae]|uniref:hypothetical protein n=1 Tax=Actinospica robiniae TaxID=304901 RepID=UPI00146FB968|nr:hypothetical protein [Actinospica robiniae]
MSNSTECPACAALTPKVPYECAVEQFGADRAVPAFPDRVHDWGLDAGGDDADVGGVEYGVEAGGELCAVIADGELEPLGLRAEVHEHVAGRLRGPLGGGVHGCAEDVDAAGGVLDHRQDVGCGAVE